MSLPPNYNHCKEHHRPGLDLDEQHTPATGSHTRKGCTTLATSATASARPCHTSNLLGLLKFQQNKVLIVFQQACLSKARSAAAAWISGQGINLVWPGNLRKSRKVVSPPEPSSWPPRIAGLYIPEESFILL
eukprot:366559-Chlamydomonas_euryale.AAC.4